MNAAHPIPQDRQAEQRAHEPSMEEILASIRRIIADDQAFSTRHADEVAPGTDEPEAAADVVPEPAAVEPAAPVRPVAPPPVDPAPLAVPQEAAEPPSSPPRAVDLRGSIDRDETEAVQPAANTAIAAVPASTAPPAPAPDTPLVSPQTDAAVSSAFGALVASQFMRETAVMPELIREMLRPMLKTWLDDNLPVIVERLVRVEIERVARGGR